MPELGSADEQIVRLFWARANARDWTAMASLLAPALRYELPQTRECIEGRDGFVDFFATWPAPWQVTIERLLAADGQVALQMRFEDGNGPPQTALGFYELASAQIQRITEFWPEPYEPPPRHSSYIRRLP